ncbi:hypothetical protein E2C01_098186 [Portunus trituberculatus]|uniref:Uncharacterized protein n=1 Tax=Portunus trituberculatus TaxID=210409 RepID=A0A5B7K2D1_PORTR|nr:hypothetical protein [Portunus trituberculatus]
MTPLYSATHPFGTLAWHCGVFVKVLVEVRAGVVRGQEQRPRTVMHHAHCCGHHARTPSTPHAHTSPRHAHHTRGAGLKIRAGVVGVV